MLSISFSDFSFNRQVYWEPENSLPPVDDPRKLARVADELTATQTAQKTEAVSASSSSNDTGVSLSLSQEAQSALFSGSAQLSISSQNSTGTNAGLNLNIQMSGESSSTSAVIGFAADGSVQVYEGGTVADFYQGDATVSLSGSSFQMDVNMTVAQLENDGEVQNLDAAMFAGSLDVQSGSSQSTGQAG